ncbi:NYN domain-containing protein [Aerosakkonema funiforme]|uniref:NYN domain-containing protein n=2 Tax=Oscillatoriophycideae TaxID=1301283 RepID=A0A926ZJJ2_9CYAN|nr:NYN domain-containing protein [Aerosakkonema funiforme]MBD2185618.1 NYN domain-containing protein [Aerosakkonema funiforme FACHB-1375]
MTPSSPSAILLVDGYNIIGAWPTLLHERDRNGLEAARWQLIESLIGYTAFQGFGTQIVFDAQYRDTPSTSEVITENLSISFTDFGQTADTFIEKICADLHHELRQFQRRLIVATSDRAQQLTIVGYGAEWMSAQRLAHEVELTAQRIRRKHKPRSQSSSRFLANSLDPKSRQRLAELRNGFR